MQPCPEHVQEFLFESKRGAEVGLRLFLLKCNECGGVRFKLFESNLRTIKGQCGECGSMFVIYDLAKYPAAMKLKAEESFTEMPCTKVQDASVFVAYEYGDFDDDHEFDCNDITWFEMFIEVDGMIQKVFSDETA